MVHTHIPKDKDMYVTLKIVTGNKDLHLFDTKCPYIVLYQNTFV